jgi:hypothetical protein
LQLRNGAFYLSQACTLAKVIGLHRQPLSKSEQVTAKTEERLKTFWSLFILDKKLSLLLGTPCSLASHDVSVPVPPTRPEDPLYGHFVARIAMARIQERIYIHLYSADAKERSSLERQSAITMLNKDLQQWHTEHLQNLQLRNTGSWAGTAFINVELVHSYYTSKILILRRSSEPGSRAKCLEAARASIRYMQQSRKSKLSIGGVMILRRYDYSDHNMAPDLSFFVGLRHTDLTIMQPVPILPRRRLPRTLLKFRVLPKPISTIKRSQPSSQLNRHAPRDHLP